MTAGGYQAAAQAAEARRLNALRMRLVERHPFWGHLLLGVRLVAAPELCALAATDCARRIWYNPDFTAHLDLEELAFLLLHEVGHQVFASLDRARGRDAHRWNCATDYAINRVVAGIPDPSDPRRSLYVPPRRFVPGLGDLAPLLDARYDGLVAEMIYEHLQGEALPRPRAAIVTLAEGVALPGVPDHGGGLDIHLPNGLADEDRDDLRGRLREAATVAVAAGERGDIPGGLDRSIGGVANAPTVPWQRLLQRYVAAALVPADYSHRRPNRRYLVDDLLVAGLVQEDHRDVVVAVDTSASMPRELLARAADELAALLAHVREVTVVVADALVRDVVAPTAVPDWLAARRFRGGGGTDHRPVFAWLSEQRRRPDLFIGISDLHSRFPARAPGFPAVWVTPADHGAAPFGHVVTF